MRQYKAWYLNGFIALLSAVFYLAAGFIVLLGFQMLFATVLLAAILFALVAVTITSLVIVQPNEAKVITFFGRYIGTVNHDGLWMVVPFTNKHKVSLKVRNFNSQTLKVNDAQGNPIEIGAVVVYKVVDTAKATFEVDNYERFVAIQSETAIRHTAAQYPYDNFSEEDELSLRGNTGEVASELMSDLQERLKVAGVQIIETRLTHLAYAPEIASAMLQRQQAVAIVSARQKIVEGAVGMVESALRELEQRGVELDGERRAAMVNNLMVTIVSDRSTTPVVNTGTLYS
ncbi:SPFH domain-containing protein [Paenibacillus tarimensis]